jgi:hypothetical protein
MRAGQSSRHQWVDGNAKPCLDADGMIAAPRIVDGQVEA